MKYQVQMRRPGTPQAVWRPFRGQLFDTNADAQQWIDERPPQDPEDARAPWEYIIVPVPE